MTVGERIAQKRKELGLSQEALGERMGVSRQAIYKWESDAALPEIEKLVNLSREFSVSVGWLLGEEDEVPEKQELTPEQLRMVEEIVGRYLAARSDPEPESDVGPDDPIGPCGEDTRGWVGPMRSSGPTEVTPPKKRRRWPWVLAAAVLAALFINLFYQLALLSWQFKDLYRSINDINSSVNDQINGITSRVESILQSQNTLTAEQSAEVSATDYRANTVTVAARALPRTFTEGMTAEFILTSDGETVTVPGKLGEDHAFTADLTGPLSDDIAVSVVFVTGDRRETQLLNQFGWMYSASFPEVSTFGSHLWGARGVIDEYATVRVSPENAARITSLRMGLFQDYKLVAWYEHLDEQPSRYQGDWENTEFFRLEGEQTMEPGYEYCLAVVIVDEYDRERVYTDMPPVIYDPDEGFTSYAVAWEQKSDPADWEY